MSDRCDMAGPTNLKQDQNDDESEVKPSKMVNKSKAQKKRRREKKNSTGVDTPSVTEDKTNSKSASKSSETTGAIQSNDQNSQTPKTNAFQLMMGSRNKRIGGNSPGREMSTDDKSELSEKGDLKARRSFLDNWAEMKGASKRKREYDEIGETINFKLQKRAKKFKEVLQARGHGSNGKVVTNRRKRRQIIVSDSDSEHCEVETIVKMCEKENDRCTNVEHKRELHSEKINERGRNKVKTRSANLRTSKIKLNKNENTTIPCRRESEEFSDTDKDSILITRKIHWHTSSKDCTPVSNHTTIAGKSKQPAAVFLKCIPKPKEDPKQIEARRRFLLSGVPSSLKREIEKQQGMEENEFDVFPAVSHVQQISSSNQFWNLPKPDLKLIYHSIHLDSNLYVSKLLKLGDHKNQSCHKSNNLIKITTREQVGKDIKAQNPDYPFDRTFKTLLSQSGYEITNVDATNNQNKEHRQPKRRGRKTKDATSKSSNRKDSSATNLDNLHALWTEKYRARSSTEIIGNQKAVSALKEWLQTRSYLNNSRGYPDSESDFDTTDGDSRESATSQGNALLLKGPCGCGKTAAVYAVCNELGFNVLEINASNKRTGKRLQQELQEATQSHQVSKKANVLNFIKEQKSTDQRFCILLVEDADIIFEQDEGFLAALTQIMTTSKRPIILTTSDYSSVHVKKIVGVRKIISFFPLPSLLVPWLQTVCLIEGCHAKTKFVKNFLRLNEGDIRQTLLQLQFWVSSHEHIQLNNHMNEEPHKLQENALFHEDRLNVAAEDCNLRFSNNFEMIRWNIPHLLNVAKSKQQSISTKLELRALSDLYDSLIVAEATNAKGQFHQTSKGRWQIKPKDSLTLDESPNGYSDDTITHNLAHFLMYGKIKMYREKYGNSSSVKGVSISNTSRQRSYSKQITGEKKLQEVIGRTHLERRSTFVDYMPVLRNINRCETERATFKRGNRCYNYLRSLGVTTGKIATDVFELDN